MARSFPVGAVMLLETGGEARFQVRPIEGVTLPAGNVEAELLMYMATCGDSSRRVLTRSTWNCLRARAALT